MPADDAAAETGAGTETDTPTIAVVDRELDPSAHDFPVDVFVPGYVSRSSSSLATLRRVALQGARLRAIHDIWSRNRSAVLVNWGSSDLMPDGVINGGRATRRSANPVASVESLGVLAPLTVFSARDIANLPGDHIVGKGFGRTGRREEVIPKDAGLNVLSQFDLVQEFIPRRREYRIHTFDAQIVSAYLRQPTDPDPMAFSQKWNFEALDEVPAEVGRVALEATQRSRLRFCGVDVVEDLDTGRTLCFATTGQPRMSERTVRNLYHLIQRDRALAGVAPVRTASGSRLSRIGDKIAGGLPHGSGMEQQHLGWSKVETRQAPPAGFGPLVGIVVPSDDFEVGDYMRSIEQAGGIPLRIPLIADKETLQATFRACHALLFAGGRDLDTAHYGESVDPTCSVMTPSVARDKTELQLMTWAVEQKVPFLAICRGMQLLNVQRKGSLWQDLTSQGVTRANHRMRTFYGHSATVHADTVLSRVVKASSIKVNSLHHQAVKDLGEGLTVSAVAPDGVVEGIEVNDHPFGVAVQFHPELLSTRRQWAYDLFSNLIDAGREQRDRVRGAAAQAPESRYLWDSPKGERTGVGA